MESTRVLFTPLMKRMTQYYIKKRCEILRERERVSLADFIEKKSEGKRVESM